MVGKSGGWFIYTWASMKFFQLFTFKKTRLPLPAEKLACLYIQWVTYKYAMREEGLWKNRVFVPTFLVYCREIKGSETLLLLIFSEKRLIVHENISPAFHWWRENVATYGKNEKAYFVTFLFTWTTKFPPVFQTGSLAHIQNSRILTTFFRFEAQVCEN